jgi:hypothetical protein
VPVVSTSKSRGVLTAAIVSFGAIAVVGPFGVDGVMVPFAQMVPLAQAASSAQAATHARAARTFSLNESSRLHLTSKHGFTLNEQGSVSGSISGAIYVHLTIVSTDRVTAEVSIYPSGSSISGDASASYRKGNTFGSFSGSLSISRGSGSYEHAYGSGLSFRGTIQRSNDAITVHVSGRVSD